MISERINECINNCISKKCRLDEYYKNLITGNFDNYYVDMMYPQIELMLDLTKKELMSLSLKLYMYNNIDKFTFSTDIISTIIDYL
jgi:hypothetical protein